MIKIKSQDDIEMAMGDLLLFATLQYAELFVSCPPEPLEKINKFLRVLQSEALKTLLFELVAEETEPGVHIQKKPAFDREILRDYGEEGLRVTTGGEMLQVGM